MKKSNVRLLLPFTKIYNSLDHSKYRIRITYQIDRVLIYLINPKNNYCLSIYILSFKFNFNNTKCKVIIYKDGKLIDGEIIKIYNDDTIALSNKSKVKKK